MTPIEPPPSMWQLDLSNAAPGDDLVGIGADLEPGTILAAYRTGLFPMGLGEHGAAPIGWWSPDPRGVLEPGSLQMSRSLRKSCRRFTWTTDRAFDEVVLACGDPSRDGRWITPEVHEAYQRLHRLGWAHSIEIWSGETLVGGLYGLALGGVFCGESMFHRATDASKVALVRLVELLGEDDVPRLVEVQWATEHLESLGVVEIPREQYLQRLPGLLDVPLPPRWR